jgi:hypothetical protein
MADSLSDKIQRLKNLPPKEKEALDATMAYPNEKMANIAFKAGMGESTYRNIMSGIYDKLVPPTEKDKFGYVIREYSEAYREMYLNVGKKPTNESPPPARPENVSTPPTKPRPTINVPPRGTRVNPTMVIIGTLGGFLIISVCAIGILVFALIQMNQPRQALAATEIPARATAVEATVVTEPTQRPTNIPAPTNIQPTDVPAPTAIPPTSVPTVSVPSIPLPFSDNFMSGVNQSWKTLHGNWITADGRYTTVFTQSEWGFVVLDDPHWTNYTVKVDYQLEKSAEGNIAILIRYNNRKEFLVFYIINVLSKGGFAIYDGRDMNEIAGRVSVPNDSLNGTLEIEANGNNFTARINGMSVQSISMSGYEQGGVGLGVKCYYTCASFGNFEVTQP